MNVKDIAFVFKDDNTVHYEFTFPLGTYF